MELWHGTRRSVRVRISDGGEEKGRNGKRQGTILSICASFFKYPVELTKSYYVCMRAGLFPTDANHSWTSCAK